ncbi:MAG: hypothetical protein GTN67_04295 [Hydrotalea flava]|nr:hypothetical protein [Hydrotalea flava]NIM37501.1 hypothetical protein [Hydrotalea flava]NIN02673.1 hypothetical protein [Hydrotalea flava]NIN14344.1 hypothetical protein [Hydrotalea flava]NIO93427.1 hypothetical protein [Hydrotalea flava]
MQESVVQKALAHTKKVTGLHGRWELLQQQPNVIADVAHNEAGIQQLLQQIAISQYRHLHLVFGMVKDKDADTVLKLLPKQASYYFTQAHIPRALAADILLEKASIFGLKGKTYSQVNEAVRAAIQQAGKNDLIVVCGSVFLIAEIDKEKFISL